MSGIPTKISHIGIAVSDLEQAISDFRAIFQFEQPERVEVASEGVKVAMIKIGDSEIELLAPISEEGAISKFLKERGEGVHHIAIKVPDVAEAIENAKAKGFKVVDSSPRKGARGAEAAFVHPKSMHGVLLELYNR